MKTLTLPLLIAGLLCFSGPASADNSSADQPAQHLLGFGLKGGVALPQLNSPMDTTFFLHLEGVYQLPFFGSRLGILTSLGYSHPSASGISDLAGVEGGSYSWTMVQRQTTWDLGFLIKLRPEPADWNLGFALGHRLLMLSTLVDGEADGEVFGEHDERATLPGAFAAFEAEYRLGPGVLTAEILFASLFQDLRTTGVYALTEIGILVGYRVVLAF